MVQVKICGNTNAKDIESAQNLGADFLGFIFTDSKRRITPKSAKEIIRQFPTFENFVGVFADQPKADVEKIATDLNLKWIQLHGEEPAEYCNYFMSRGFKIIKTFHVEKFIDHEKLNTYRVSAFLFDTHSSHEKGGTGRKFDWQLLSNLFVKTPFFVAGGLTAGNVQLAIKTTNPFGVDVASGVESSAGIKDHQLMQEFIKEAKKNKRTSGREL